MVLREAIKVTIEIKGKDDLAVAVFCDVPTNYCPSLDAVRASDKVKYAIPIHAQSERTRIVKSEIRVILH